MTTIYSKLIAGALMALLAGTVSAQDLRQEINVDREAKVEVAEADKLPLLPEAALAPTPRPEVPQWSAAGIEIVPVGASGVVEPPLPGVPQAGLLGYASLALGGPLLDGSFSAGYRIVSTSTSRLDARLQALTDNYSRRGFYMRSNLAHAALAGSHWFKGAGLLSAAVSFEWQRFNLHDFELLTPRQQMWQGSWRLGLDAAWYGGSLDAFAYNLRLRAGHTAFSKAVANLDKPADTGLGLEARGRLNLSEDASQSMAVSLLAGVDMLSAVDTRAVVTLLPALEWSNAEADVKVGPRLDINANCHTPALNLSPMLEAAWHPATYFAASLRAGGMQRLASLAAMQRVTPRLAPWQRQWPVERVPFTAGATLTAGPWRGLSFSLTADWAKGTAVLMPVEATMGAVWMAAFAPQRVIGWKVGASLTAQAGRWAEIEASWATASNRPGHGWWEWTDRAAHVIDVKVTSSPLKQLDLTLGWQLRTGRRLLTPDGLGGWLTDPLGRVSNLRLRGVWHFTPCLSAFAEGCNLLANRHVDVSLTPSAGVRAFVGASLAF